MDLPVFSGNITVPKEQAVGHSKKIKIPEIFLQPKADWLKSYLKNYFFYYPKDKFKRINDNTFERVDDEKGTRKGVTKIFI